MVGRIAHVVAIQADGGKARVRPQQLRTRNGWVTDRRRTRDLAEVWIGHLLQQRIALSKLLDGELIDVAIRNANMGDLRARVGDFGNEVV